MRANPLVIALALLVPTASLSLACGIAVDGECQGFAACVDEEPPQKPAPVDLPLDFPPPIDGGSDARRDATTDATTDADAGDPCDGIVCDGPHGVFECQAGACVTVQCDDGFADCDGDATNGCEPLTTYYVDNDGDGHGDIAGPIQACTAPAGYSELNDDCHDGDGRAFPGQTEHFETPRPDGSFDFDCDGHETQKLTVVDPRYCLCAWGQCGVSLGWRDAVPACGESGAFVKSAARRYNCDVEYEVRAQACR